MKRLRALLALVCHVVTFGAPVADAAFFHHDPLERRSHIEAADARCHGETCALGAPLQSVMPVPPATDTLRDSPLLVAAAPVVVPSRPTDRRPERPLGPRGPPVRT